MNCLYKRNKFPNFSYSNDYSNNEFENYTPIIKSHRLLNSVKKLKIHKKGKSLELNFFHKSLIKNKIEHLKSYSSTENSQNSERYKILPTFTSKNFHSNKELNSAIENQIGILSFSSPRTFSLKSLVKSNSKKKKQNNEFRNSVSPDKKKGYFLTDYNSSNYNNSLNIYSYNNGKSLLDFNNKSKQIRYDKIKLNLKKIEVGKTKESNNNKKDLLKLKKYNFIQTKNLYNIFQDNNDKYYKFLENQIKIEKDTRDILIEKTIQLRTDIFYLKHKLGKLKNFVEHNINNKLFLLCVKNHTNILKNFPLEDQNDYIADQKLLEILDSMVSQKKFKSKKYSVTFLITGIDNIYDEDENLLNKISQQKPIFNSVELFEQNLDIISTNIKNSLIQYNELQDEINLLREELSSKIKESILFEENNKKYIENYNFHLRKINQKEIEYKSLLNIKKHSFKKIGEKLSIKVEKKITEIYKYIKLKTNLIPISIKNEDEEINSIERLKSIEFAFLSLLSFVQKLKKENNQDYFILQKEIDENRKIRHNEIQKELIKKQYAEKVKRVLLKNKKLIFKPLRKVPNNYKYK
jgi:hypothetical protein